MRAFLTLRNSLLTRPKSGDDRRLARLQAPRGAGGRGGQPGAHGASHTDPLSLGGSLRAGTASESSGLLSRTTSLGTTVG